MVKTIDEKTTIKYKQAIVKMADIAEKLYPMTESETEIFKTRLSNMWGKFINASLACDDLKQEYNY